ncbi:MAG TPA: hemolysin [Cryomorphaceae bacterium]|nr:hemolysin [Owenweeksia sp.]HAD97293.1 hemolysin [Cryomorphaceae bacterium]HCQ17427.1 hemolysin [Cryomorphaceae bacterium]
MKNIIPAVDRKAILDELTEETFLRHTNKGGNQLYLVTHHNAPNVMREIGRLREIAFRTAGGGTGKQLDVDAYDTAKVPFEQLVLWDPEDQEILAGYRLLKCKDAERDEEGKIVSATAHLFDLDERFYSEYLPYTIELGRSFVQPNYQRNGSRKGLFSMDNLWDGLGAILVRNPDVKYLFGKVTMYPSYQREARNMILCFLKTKFPDPEGLVRPENPLVSDEELETFKHHFEGLEYKEAYNKLRELVREKGENIPPLINTYMNISDSMKTFGTAANYEFGEVEETGIMITVDDIFPEKKDRHMLTYESTREYIGPLKKWEEN